jgi:hypothetical protein
MPSLANPNGTCPRNCSCSALFLDVTIQLTSNSMPGLDHLGYGNDYCQGCRVLLEGKVRPAWVHTGLLSSPAGVYGGQYWTKHRGCNYPCFGKPQGKPYSSHLELTMSYRLSGHNNTFPVTCPAGTVPGLLPQHVQSRR